VTKLHTLPAEMSRLSQVKVSFPPQEEKVRPLSVKGGAVSTLQEYNERHTYIGFNPSATGFAENLQLHKRMNLAAAKRAAKHFEYVLESLFPH
jgi:hypothetical protein